MMEEWRKIEGFPNYSVSNLGGIRNDKFNRVLNPFDAGGYEHVSLWADNKRSDKKVHRLVAIAFLENRENKLEVNHIDGDKKNNSVSNLEWATRLENMRHAKITGLRDGINLRGSNNGMSKFTDSQRDVVVEDQRTLQQIADDYGVTKQAIWYIKKTWKKKGESA
ncbi:NUMOD4 motif-containing HNH endonuclease [Psychrobacillus sp. MER TA 17]|nr:NUMOD4 motif-containing HNH endonuclease [Psychrobacillus sp. MER TA 17]